MNWPIKARDIMHYEGTLEQIGSDIFTVSGRGNLIIKNGVVLCQSHPHLRYTRDKEEAKSILADIKRRGAVDFIASSLSYLADEVKTMHSCIDVKYCTKLVKKLEKHITGEL